MACQPLWVLALQIFDRLSKEVWFRRPLNCAVASLISSTEAKEFLERNLLSKGSLSMAISSLRQIISLSNFFFASL